MKPGRKESRVGSGSGFVVCLVSFSFKSSFVFSEVPFGSVEVPFGAVEVPFGTAVVRFGSVELPFSSVEVILSSVEVPEKSIIFLILLIDYDAKFCRE